MGIITEQISGTTISVSISSSNLSSAVYETEEKTLTITFNSGSVYVYYGVPWDVFTKLRMSKSQGQYFNKEISRSYKYQKIK